MFTLAITIGIFSYIIFCFGQIGLLYPWIIATTTICYSLVIYFLIKKRFIKEDQSSSFSLKKFTGLRTPFHVFLLALIVMLIIINLVGALGPETAFDALWYHLTLPKLYIQNHSIPHLSGNLLYYSDMPKLTELLYVVVLMFGNEIAAKLVHFLFGLFVLMSLYLFSKEYFSVRVALLAVLIFSSNLVFSWESTTAYVDLARTFFEFLAFWGFLNFDKTKKISWLIESAIMLGLAISAKLLALSSLVIFVCLLIVTGIKQKVHVKTVFFRCIIFSGVAFLIPLPWFVVSFINTGNPFFPFFTNLYPIGPSSNVWSLVQMIADIGTVLINAADPISPIYLMVFPLIIVTYRQMGKEDRLMVYYSILSMLLWYLLPRTGGGRFLLPYLPVFSVIVARVMIFMTEKRPRILFLTRLLFAIVIALSLVTIIYRGVAVSRYIPVIFGKETKENFLRNNLNFRFGDFYDVDGYFAQHLDENGKVLLYGFHNLYYVNFPFIDSSWVKKGDTFSYIATQHVSLPKQFSYWTAIYHNTTTDVTLYKNGDRLWMY